MYKDGVQESERTGRQSNVTFDYDKIAETCIRYLGIDNFDEIDKLSLREYNILMQAHNLKQVDKALELHMAAWLHIQAGAMKQSGKRQVPVYRKFKDFYDYDKALNEARGEKEPSKFDNLSRHLKEKKNG